MNPLDIHTVTSDYGVGAPTTYLRTFYTHADGTVLCATGQTIEEVRSNLNKHIAEHEVYAKLSDVEKLKVFLSLPYPSDKDRNDAIKSLIHVVMELVERPHHQHYMFGGPLVGRVGEQ